MGAKFNKMKKVIETFNSENTSAVLDLCISSQITDQKTVMSLSLIPRGGIGLWRISYRIKSAGGNFARCGEVIKKWIDEDPNRRIFCWDFEKAYITCYTEPQIERAYQALLELWEAIKIAAATPSPKAMVAKNKLEELGFK